MEAKRRGKVINVEKGLIKRKLKEIKLKEEKIQFKFTKRTYILIGIIILAFVSFYFIENYHIYGLVIKRNISSENAKIIETSSMSNIVADYGENILVYSNKSITVYDKNGLEVWTKTLDEAFTPKIYTAGEYIQLINEDTGYVYIYKGKYETGRIRISDGKIVSGKITEKGKTIIEYSLPGYKAIFGVYDEKGNELYQIKLSTDMVSDYAMSADEKHIAYSYADISGISIVTKIAVINLDENSENTVISKPNQLNYKMFWHGKNIFVMFDNDIVKYNIKSKKTEEYNTYDLSVVDIDIDPKRISFITSNNLGYSLNILKYGSETSKQISVQDNPKYMIYKNDLIYVVFDKEIAIYNSFGNMIKDYKSDTVITKPIIFNQGKSIAYTVTNKIIIFTI